MLRVRSTACLAFAATIAVVSVSTAFAQAEPTTASEYYERGRQHYAANEFAEAAAAFGKAYELDPNDRSLFAWAQAVRLSGDCDKAAELYQRLLDRGQPEAQATAIRKAKESCRPSDTQQREPSETRPREPANPPERTPSPAVVDTTEPRDPPSRFGAHVMMASGVTVLGGAVGFLLARNRRNDAAEDADSIEDFERHKDRAELYNRVAIGGFVAGGLLVGGATAWYLVALGESRADANAAVFADSETIWVSVGGRF